MPARGSVTRCAYCGRPFAATHVLLHQARCPESPQWIDRQRAALDDGAGVIRSSTDYQRDSRGGLNMKQLVAHFGTWTKVAHAYGLRWVNRRVESAHRGPRPDWSDKPAKPRVGTDGPDDDLAYLTWQSPHTLYTPHGLPAVAVCETEREVSYKLR